MNKHQSPLRRALNRALTRLFNNGHFSTVAAYRARFIYFINFLEESGILTPNNITKKVVDAYAQHICERINNKTLSLATGVNRISCVNVVLRGFFGHDRYFVTPRSVLPGRTYVRTKIPVGLDMQSVVAAYAYLYDYGTEYVGIVIIAMRVLGMRIKEAIMQDYARMLDEAVSGHVQITTGTKNGRGAYVERNVPVDPIFMPILQRAAEIQGTRKNLINPGSNYVRTLSRVYYYYAKARAKFGLSKPHNFRAAYACDRYQVITGAEAPVIVGRRIASKELDHLARCTIAKELGHGRPGVCVSYIGGAK